MVERHKTLGAEIVSNTPEEMRAFTEAEMKKWGDAARAAGIQPQLSLCVQWGSRDGAIPHVALGFFDFAVAINPILETAQITHIGIAHIVQRLQHQRRTPARCAIGDNGFGAIEIRIMQRG